MCLVSECICQFHAYKVILVHDHEIKDVLPLSNHILTKWILLITGTCVEMDGASLIHLSLSTVDEQSTFNSSFAMSLSLQWRLMGQVDSPLSFYGG